MLEKQLWIYYLGLIPEELELYDINKKYSMVNKF